MNETIETSRQAHPSLHETLVKQCVDTPNSSSCSSISSTSSGCESDAVRKTELWVSSVYSANSSRTRDAVSVNDRATRGDGRGDKKEFERVEVRRKGVKTTFQTLRMQTHLRDMQWRLGIIQKLMQKAARQDRLCFSAQEIAAATAEGSCMPSMAVREGNHQLADVQALKANAHVDESLKLASVSLSGSTDDVSNKKVNGSRHDLNSSSRIMSEEGDTHASEMSTLQNQVKALQAQLQDAADENQHLQSTVKRLKQENARLQAQATFHPSTEICEDGSGSTVLKHNQELDTNDNSGDQNSNMACTSTAIFEEVSAFQLVMVKDMKVLRNHERCQHKLHELWGTIWKLKAFVEAYAIERDVMKLQRDDALVEAEHADNANVKLAGSGNLQQKIKYLEQLKNDNRTLCRKNRALNMRIVKQRADLVRVKSGCPPIADDVPTVDTTDSASLDDLLHELDEPTVRNDEEILRSMREFSRFLEQRLVRLHLAKRELQTSDDGSVEVTKLEGGTVIGELLAMPNAGGVYS